MKKSMKEKVQAIADAVGGTIYEGYSGRCMFGAECFGVVCGYDSMAKAISAGRRRGLRDARTDNLGLDMIVYWPSARPEEQ